MFLASCSTSSFMGLSKSKYVDNEITEMNQSVESITDLETRLAEVERIAGNAANLDAEMQQVIQIGDDLTASNTALTTRVDDLTASDTVLHTRVDALPTDIVAGLINAMQAYLDSLAPSALDETADPAETAETE